MSHHEWKIRYILKDATTEVAFLYQNEDVKKEVKHILKILSEQDDPRQPSVSSGLIVDEVEFDAPSWFRVKIPRYGNSHHL